MPILNCWKAYCQIVCVYIDMHFSCRFDHWQTRIGAIMMIHESKKDKDRPSLFFGQQQQPQMKEKTTQSKVSILLQAGTSNQLTRSLCLFLNHRVLLLVYQGIRSCSIASLFSVLLPQLSFSLDPLSFIISFLHYLNSFSWWFLPSLAFESEFANTC